MFISLCTINYQKLSSSQCDMFDYESSVQKVYCQVLLLLKSLVDLQDSTGLDINIEDFFYIGDDGAVYIAQDLGEFVADSCLFYEYQYYYVMQSLFSLLPYYQYLAYLEENEIISSESSEEDIMYALSQKPDDFVLDIPLSGDNYFAQYFWISEMVTLWMEVNLSL